MSVWRSRFYRIKFGEMKKQCSEYNLVISRSRRMYRISLCGGVCKSFGKKENTPLDQTISLGFFLSVRSTV